MLPTAIKLMLMVLTTADFQHAMNYNINARQEREKQMAENLKQQGIEPENYPQLGTAFWGNNPENNYGFGASNISANIENRQNQTPLPNVGNINQGIGINHNPTISAPSQVGTNSFLNASPFGKTMFPYNDSNKSSEQLNRQNQYINSALFPKSMANDDMSYKVAQNNLSNTAKDWELQPSVNLSDDKLINMMYPIMQDHENAKLFPYYDTRWNITVGVGNNVNNKDSFYKTNWKVNGNPADKHYIDSCLENLKKEKQRIQNELIASKKKPNEHNYKADYFKKFCNINIDDDTMYKMYYDHMKDDLKSLRKLIPNFDELSLNKRFVLMDYMYSLGSKKFSEEEFPNFIKGARTNNLDLMLKHDHRLGIDERRNKWTDKMLRKDLENQE